MAFIDNSQQLYNQRQQALRERQDRTDVNFLGAFQGLDNMAQRDKAEALQQAELARQDEIKRRQEYLQLAQLEQEALKNGQKFDREAYLAGLNKPAPAQEMTTDVPWPSKLFGKGSAPAKVQPMILPPTGAMAGLTENKPLFQETPEGAAAKKRKIAKEELDIENARLANRKTLAELGQTRQRPNPLDQSADDLRKEIQGLQVTKDLYTIDSALGKISAAAKSDNAAGDISLLFSFAKVLDPSSTVREGEFATLQNSGSLPDTVKNAAARLASGQRLTPEQRRAFVEQAQNVARSNYDTYQKALHPQMTAIQGRGLNRDYILPRFESFEKMYNQAPTQIVTTVAPPPGFDTVQIPGLYQMPGAQGVQIPGLPTAQAYQGPMRPQATPAFTPEQVKGMSRADKIRAVQAMGQARMGQ